jgi:putative tryptophan/tyrosine transport system substrate-binding protein
MFGMKRREFITLLGGAAAWPLAARAQQPAMPVVGFLSSRSPTTDAPLIAVISQGLKESGFTDGQNVAVDYRWAEGQYERLAALAAEFVNRRVAVIAAASVPSALAAKAATSTIPIVFVSGVDPVKLGFVASLNRPGGNMTGVNVITTTLEAKRFELLRNVVRTGAPIAVLVNPANPDSDFQQQDLQTAAQVTAQGIFVLKATNERDFEPVFGAIAQGRAGAVLVANDAFFLTQRARLAALAERYAVPAMYPYREYAEAGGLMSYGPDLGAAYRQAGIYMGRILKGEKPADLPVVQPTRFHFVINLKAAKALGLQIPDKLLALADEVIE